MCPMNTDLDYTKYNSYAKKVYDLLEDKRSRLRLAAYNVDSSRSFNEGIQTFWQERKATLKLLVEYIGEEEAERFSQLPTIIIQAHPSFLAMDYMKREWAKQEVDNQTNLVIAVLNRIKDGSIEFDGLDVRRKRELVLQELF